MKVNVTATRCIVENDVELNAGEYNINKFYFTFSPEYIDNYVKKALFVAKDQPPIEMVIANDECDIPNDILKKPGVYMVGVYAYEIDENNELILRYSPEPTHFYVNRGSYIENVESPTEPDPDEFAQYYQAMQDLIAAAKPEFKEYIDENLPTVEVGEVETLPPGSQATVTNSGTDRNPIFNFGIPEGLKGDSVGAIEIDSNDETYQIKMKLYDNNRQIIAESNTIDLPIENKVDKINGKSLSTNDFTNELKNKLDNVEDYAEVNVIQTISKNGTPITVEGKNVNIVVPTNTSNLNNDSGFITSEVDDLENYYDKTVSDNKFALITESGKIIDLSIDNSTYVMTITLKDRDANVLSSSDVDLPLETMVVDAYYDKYSKEIVLTLQSGTSTRFSVADLVSGLQSEITANNKLKSDLVDDTNQVHKFVTSEEKTTWNSKSDFSGSYNDLTDVPTIPTQLDELSDDSTHRLVTDDEKTTWNGKQDKINDLETIRSGAASGKTAVQFNDLATVATSGSYNDLSNKPTIPTKLSQLSDDSTHRLVSDTEKTTWNSKQSLLVSGTNIKTINNESILGSGNINIQGGSGSSEWGNITGTLSDQNDLKNALDAKANTSSVPTKTSDLTNDSGFIDGLFIATYGTTSFNDVKAAVQANKIVYCYAPSNNRYAFLAYGTTSSGYEFQYYRSLGSPTETNQPDEVYVYKITSSGWTTITRQASSTITAGTGLSRTYTPSTRTVNLSVDTGTIAQKSDIPTKVSQLTNDSGYLTSETDPVFNASVAKNITSTDITNWNNKSDFSGSYNDLSNKPTIPTNTSQLTNNSNFVSDSAYVHTDNNYTDNEKNKLADLENYDDTEIKESIMDLDNSITDLDNGLLTIDKIKADKTDIPKNTSDLNNDSGFITKNVNDLTHYTLDTDTGSFIDLEINTTTYVVTLSLKNSEGTVISSDSIDLPLENVVVSGSYDNSSQKIILTLQNGTTVDIPVGDLVAGLQTEITSSNKIASDLIDDSNSGNKFVTTSEKSTWNGKQNAITSSNKLSASLISGLSEVATSGSYNDLSNKPTIPTRVTESTVSGWGFTKNTGTYIKPSTGIPKTDLASGVQTSLGKADTALQSISSSDVTTALGYTPYNSTNPNRYTSNTGTITGVKMNGSTIASSGVADLGTVITEHQDISGKQDKIAAGTNISIASDGKTISATDTTYSNATTTTAGLMSSDDKTKLNGIETGATKNLNYYGTCATSAATQAKVVVCEGFVLENGATISVLFTNAQTYDGTPTLNVNSTGAKNVHFKQGIKAIRYIWSAGEIIDFTYDGTCWVMHRSALASTVYYGLAKYSDSLTSISSALGATSKAINTAMANIISGAPIYTASSTYAVGDRVRYSNNVWECITAITHAEVWTDAHWKTVAPLQEQIDDKQDLLVSGTNIKTINNQSILGSGNITIEGGGSGTVDTAMSDSSTNAVQNRVIKSYVDDAIEANNIDVQINGTSIVSNNVANILTEGVYGTRNKLLTKGYADTHYVLEEIIDDNVGYMYIIPNIKDDKDVDFLINAQSNLDSEAYADMNFGVEYDEDKGRGNGYFRLALYDAGSIEIDNNGTKITKVITPTNDGDAVNKKYVDSLVGDIGTILDNINGEVIGG